LNNFFKEPGFLSGLLKVLWFGPKNPCCIEHPGSIKRNADEGTGEFPTLSTPRISRSI